MNQSTVVNKFTRNKLSQLQTFKTNKTFTVALSHEHAFIVIVLCAILNWLTGKS